MSRDGQGTKWLRNMPKISIAWVGCTNITDRRQTTDRQAHLRRHNANVNGWLDFCLSFVPVDSIDLVDLSWRSRLTRLLENSIDSIDRLDRFRGLIAPQQTWSAVISNLHVATTDDAATRWFNHVVASSCWSEIDTTLRCYAARPP